MHEILKKWLAPCAIAFLTVHAFDEGHAQSVNPINRAAPLNAPTQPMQLPSSPLPPAAGQSIDKNPVKSTLFFPEATPTRPTVNLKMKEADTADKKSSEKKTPNE